MRYSKLKLPNDEEQILLYSLPGFPDQGNPGEECAQKDQLGSYCLYDLSHWSSDFCGLLSNPTHLLYQWGWEGGHRESCDPLPGRYPCRPLVCRNRQSCIPRRHSFQFQLSELGIAKRSTGRAPSDRKSISLNSSHVAISYAVFCL